MGAIIKRKILRILYEVSAVWMWNKLKLRGSSRDKKGNERLVYFEDGFSKLTDCLKKKKIEANDGKIF